MSILIANTFAINGVTHYPQSMPEKRKRESAQRKTNQRNAIQKVFRQNDRPLGIDEILETGRRTVASLNQATVYRNLKLLVEKGWLKKIDQPPLGTLYERAGKEHHHHFHCRTCGRFFELPSCALNENKFTPPDFVTYGHEVLLFGICSFCKRRE